MIRALNRAFVCGWTDITGVADYAGTSGTHAPSYPAVYTTNCAGHHNVQMFFLTPDGQVLHCLPGFWERGAFLEELKLACKLGDVLQSPKLSIVEKNRAFLDLQLGHALEHDHATRTRSALQGFDRFEVAGEGSDFLRAERGFLADRGWGPRLKSTDQVLHERMARRPFQRFESFDVAAYVDMGKKAFDSHFDGCDGDHAGQACSESLAAVAAGRVVPGSPGAGQATPARPTRTPGSGPAPAPSRGFGGAGGAPATPSLTLGR
ncbi:MAG: hypothetical protein KDD82_01495 [Planctomycetes bacterium]|nr:hypothetical protein [Planctomycetota bacterium]